MLSGNMNNSPPRISDNTINEVKQNADICDVISRHVALRKRGKELMGLCPFHKETTPSFSVSPSKQMYYCFGCHTGGDVIKFAMDFHSQSFSEAVLGLANQYGVAVISSSPEYDLKLSAKKRRDESIYEVVASSNIFYQSKLHSPEGHSAMEYLTKERGISIESIKEFELGYAPNNGRSLYDYLTKDKGYPYDIVKSSGVMSSNGQYDLFRDRVMIPIKDARGRVIAFGGRAMGNAMPKYMNSSESDIFSKRDNLFAIDIARDAITKLNSVIVVEGYFDVIALHSSGIKNAVASLGTALSLSQMKLAAKYTDFGSLILNFDSDDAGVNATKKCITESIDSEHCGLDIKVLCLDGCKDAAQFMSTHAPREYISLAEKSVHYIQWQIDKASMGLDVSKASIYSKVYKSLIDIIKNLRDNAMRAFYIPICADILSNKNQSIRNMLIKKITSECMGKPIAQEPSPESKHTAKSQHEINELSLLRVYIHMPEHRKLIWEIIRDRRIQFTISSHRLIWQILVADHYMDSHSSMIEPCQLVDSLHRYMIDGEYDIPLIPELLFNSDDGSLSAHGDKCVKYLINQLDISLSRSRCKYLMDLWKDIDPLVDQKKSEGYYRMFLEEKTRIAEITSCQSAMFSEIIYGNTPQ